MMAQLSALVGRLIGWITRRPDPLAENRRRAVARARQIAGTKITYKLGAGGRDPKAESPCTVRDGVLGCDCVGFTSWCLGHDRHQPKTFPFYDGWINTDSLMMDARGKQTWYTEIARPEPGDVVVFSSITKNGVRERIGHIGLVVEVPDDLPDDVYAYEATERRKWLARVKVIDCAGASSRAPYAVKETTAAASWDKPDAMFARCVRTPEV